MSFDALFLGYGPITATLAQKLVLNGLRVLVVSNRFAATNLESNFPKDLLRIYNWAEAIDSRVRAETTYIGWRRTPENQVLCEELLEWTFSTRLKTEKILHLSSASVYSGEKTNFSEVDFDFRVENGTLNSKQQLEALVFSLSNEKKTKYVNYRISNVYGPTLTAGFINESLVNVKNKTPIKLYRSIDLTRDYLSIDDLVYALLKLRSMEIDGESINISTGQGLAISEIMNLFRIFTTRKIQHVEVEAPSKIISRSVLSCEKLRRIITWNPKPLADNLRLLIQEFDLEEDVTR